VAGKHGCHSLDASPARVALAGEIDAVGVVHDAIEDGVGVGRISDQLVPFVDGILLVMIVDRP
jgi:hypothetical protein